MNESGKLNIEDIKGVLIPGVPFGSKIYFHDQIDSTNTEAKRLLTEHRGEGKTLHGILVLAEEQTNGRGRLGRDWSSPHEGGIWMSLVLQPELPAQICPMLTIVAALAVNSAIREHTGLSSFIKWPNDIIIEGRKVCGILTEMAGLSQGIPDIVIGIGVNANRSEFPEELRDSATSLALEKGEKINRNALIGKILNRFEGYYQQFLRSRDLSELKAEYEEFLVNRGKQVRVLEREGEYTGTALGINEQGVLLVESKDEIREIISGEVSVRGLYGYV
jgi:BirA family transcriptional regulator, biotin operon repressor / biotin---[acetyl-CoA-carboxylase] ligase